MDFQAFRSSCIGDQIGVTAAYRALQDKLIDLLNGWSRKRHGLPG